MAYGYSDPYGRRRGTHPILMRLLFAALLAAVPIGGLLIRGCQEGPFGRNQVVAINPEQEEALGAQAFREVLSKERVVRQGPLVDVIRDIATRLAEAARHEGFLKQTAQAEQPMQWAVEVVDSEQQNAFCLPGGKIVVYTGILP